MPSLAPTRFKPGSNPGGQDLPSFVGMLASTVRSNMFSKRISPESGRNHTFSARKSSCNRPVSRSINTDRARVTESANLARRGILAPDSINSFNVTTWEQSTWESFIVAVRVRLALD